MLTARSILAHENTGRAYRPPPWTDRSRKGPHGFRPAIGLGSSQRDASQVLHRCTDVRGRRQLEIDSEYFPRAVLVGETPGSGGRETSSDRRDRAPEASEHAREGRWGQIGHGGGSDTSVDGWLTYDERRLPRFVATAAGFFDGPVHQAAVQPPSMHRLAPVICPAESDVR